jgi:DNA-binding IclR family transcriptional regulator
MTPEQPSDDWLIHQLNRNPQLKNRIKSLLLVVDNAAGDVTLADAAERRVIEEIRQMGQEALEAWAIRQVEQLTEALEEAPGIWRNGQKKSAGTVRSVTSK